VVDYESLRAPSLRRLSPGAVGERGKESYAYGRRSSIISS
jgi:hypothetical protein